MRLHKGNFFSKKKREKNKRAKTLFFVKKGEKQKCRSSQIRVLEGDHRQRKHEKEKENTCGKTEKNKKRKKRQQMNQWMNKRRTQRGNACM